MMKISALDGLKTKIFFLQFSVLYVTSHHLYMFFYFILNIFLIFINKKKKKTTNSNCKTGGNKQISLTSSSSSLSGFQTLPSSSNGGNPKSYQTPSPSCCTHPISHQPLHPRLQWRPARTRSSTCSTRRCNPPQESPGFAISRGRLRSVS